MPTGDCTGYAADQAHVQLGQLSGTTVRSADNYEDSTRDQKDLQDISQTLIHHPQKLP